MRGSACNRIESKTRKHNAGTQRVKNPTEPLRPSRGQRVNLGSDGPARLSSPKSSPYIAHPELLTPSLTEKASGRRAPKRSRRRGRRTVRPELRDVSS